MKKSFILVAMLMFGANAFALGGNEWVDRWKDPAYVDAYYKVEAYKKELAIACEVEEETEASIAACEELDDLDGYTLENFKEDFIAFTYYLGKTEQDRIHPKF